MRTGHLAAAVLCGYLLAPSGPQAGLYNTAEPLPGPSSDFRQFRATLADLLGIANDQRETPLRKHYLDRVKDLEAKGRLLGLTTEDRVNLSAYLIRLGKHQQAIEVLMPVARESDNFMVLSNLATAYQLSGQLERAIDTLREALKVWPRMWPGWSTAQLDWYRRAETKQLELLQLRLDEARRQPPGQRQTTLKLDPLFPGVRFVADSGQYEAGQLAAANRAALPADALPLVQQLLTWLPQDNALYWLLGELLNAQGEVTDAATVLEELVFVRRLEAPDLRRHRQVLNEGKAMTARFNEAKRQVAQLQPVLKEGRILNWLAPRGELANGLSPLLSEATWVGILTELNRRDQVADLGPRVPSPQPTLPPPPAPASWLPDSQKLVIVGSVTGLIVLLLAYFQVRELRRRRHSHAAAPRG